MSRGDIPLLGHGTWELRGKECIESVRLALEVGYRHIDTAVIYENHREVAKGIGDFPRDELFLTSKFVCEEVDDENAVPQVISRILEELQTDYLDLLLIHWPDRSKPLEAILRSMQEDKRVRFAGVSNYTMHHLQDAYDAGLAVAFNQVELHPYLSQKQLFDFGQKHGTRLISYRPFGQGKLLQDEPLFAEIGKAHHKSGAQVILRWITQKGIPVIPKASSREHLLENFSIFDFFLSDEEMEAIDSLNRNFRYCDPDWDEFDY